MFVNLLFVYLFKMLYSLVPIKEENNCYVMQTREHYRSFNHEIKRTFPNMQTKEHTMIMQIK